MAREPIVWTCGKCGITATDSAVKFCKACGTELAADGTRYDLSELDEKGRKAAKAMLTHILCARCKKELTPNESWDYCGYCGEYLRSEKGKLLARVLFMTRADPPQKPY